jgi:hypothetical protein
MRRSFITSPCAAGDDMGDVNRHSKRSARTGENVTVFARERMRPRTASRRPCCRVATQPPHSHCAIKGCKAEIQLCRTGCSAWEQPLHRRTEKIGACVADPFANGEGAEEIDAFTIPVGRRRRVYRPEVGGWRTKARTVNSRML